MPTYGGNPSYNLRNGACEVRLADDGSAYDVVNSHLVNSFHVKVRILGRLVGGKNGVWHARK